MLNVANIDLSDTVNQSQMVTMICAHVQHFQIISKVYNPIYVLV